MKITVVGTGYVGLVTGVCFAETGNDVVCVDIDQHKIQQLKQGIIPIYEPGLDILFHRNTKEGRLTFSTSIQEGIQHGQIIFMALPTPPGEDGSADLSYILNAAAEIAGLIKRYTVIVDKSTVPVGTAEKVRDIMLPKLPQELFDVVSNPEFLREGVAVEDFMKPDRVVIGADSERAKKLMELLYAPFVRQGNPVLFMDIRSAEMTKYAANAYLATRISFMNEIANLCEKLGANVDHVRRGIGSDNRIGKRFLFPGVGYGGSCFPKDVQALHRTAKSKDYQFKILDAVMQVNARQKELFADRVLDFFGHNLKDKKIAVWGLAFKPNTDDVREAPAITIIRKLQDNGAEILAFDPEAMPTFKKFSGLELNYATTATDALHEADALVLITEWNEFRSPDFTEMKSMMRQPVIFDGRNVYDPDFVHAQGFIYESIGRP